MVRRFASPLWGEAGFRAPNGAALKPGEGTCSDRETAAFLHCLTEIWDQHVGWPWFNGSSSRLPLRGLNKSPHPGRGAPAASAAGAAQRAPGPVGRGNRRLRIPVVAWAGTVPRSPRLPLAEDGSGAVHAIWSPPNSPAESTSPPDKSAGPAPESCVGPE